MTIERFSYKPPLPVPNAQHVGQNLQDYLVRASQRKNIPPDYCIDITPEKSDLSVLLRTRNSSHGDTEDTVGIVEILRHDNSKETHPVKHDCPVFGLIGVETRGETITGMELGEIILYTPSDSSPSEDAATEKASIPIENVPLFATVIREAPIEI